MKHNNSRRPMSPLTEPPLHVAGQSTRERAENILTEEFAPWLAVCAFAAISAGLEWVRWALSAPPAPVLITLLAAGLIAYFVFRRLPRILAEARQNFLGARGEQSVAEQLDWLRPDGYQVLHDLVEDGCNIDHVLIGPTGAYVIETKTRSKHSDKRDVHVTFDGAQVLVDGHAPDRDPVRQVQANCDLIRDILRKNGVSPAPTVRGVIVFPGWYVKSRRQSGSVWVLNPKQLPGRVRAQKPELNEREVERIANVLIGSARRSQEAVST